MDETGHQFRQTQTHKSSTRRQRTCEWLLFAQIKLVLFRKYYIILNILQNTLTVLSRHKQVI
jgi:hypothetical protein